MCGVCISCHYACVCARTVSTFVPGANLESDCVLMLPLHIIDVPGHASHGVDGLLYHLIAILLWVKVLGYFLKKSTDMSKQLHDNTSIEMCVFFWMQIYYRSNVFILAFVPNLYSKSICKKACTLWFEFVCTWSRRWYLRILWTGLSR